MVNLLLEGVSVTNQKPPSTARTQSARGWPSRQRLFWADAQIFRPTGTVYSRPRGLRGLLANRGFADISCTRSRNLVVRHLSHGIIVQDLQSSGVYSYGGSFFRVVHPAELAAAGSRPARQRGVADVRGCLRPARLSPLPGRGAAPGGCRKRHLGAFCPGQSVHPQFQLPTGPRPLSGLAGNRDSQRNQSLPQKR